MAFKDRVNLLIEDREGQTHENLGRKAARCQRIADDITIRYLQTLLKGPRQPRKIDRQALASALDVRPHEFLEGREREIAYFAAARIKSDALVEEFSEYVASNPRFRMEEIEGEDLSLLFEQFVSQNQIQDEIRLFNLDDEQ